jgi:hypothetical protein
MLRRVQIDMQAKWRGVFAIVFGVMIWAATVALLQVCIFICLSEPIRRGGTLARVFGRLYRSRLWAVTGHKAIGNGPERVAWTAQYWYYVDHEIGEGYRHEQDLNDHPPCIALGRGSTVDRQCVRSHCGGRQEM